MKGKIVALLTAFFLLSDSALGCTCVYGSLKSRYKSAEAIFVGRYVSDEPSDKRLIQNYNPDLLTFKAIKSWKGISKEYVSIELAEFPKTSGTYPLIYQFDETKEYLVFAYGDELKVEVECSDTKPLTDNNGTREEIAKLNSWWFRFKARFWSF